MREHWMYTLYTFLHENLEEASPSRQKKMVLLLRWCSMYGQGDVYDMIWPGEKILSFFGFNLSKWIQKDFPGVWFWRQEGGMH